MLNLPTEAWPQEMMSPGLWRTKGNSQIYPLVLFYDPLTFLQKSEATQNWILSAQDSINCRFINGYVKEVVWVVHVADVHHFVNHLWSVLISIFHLLNNHVRNVHIPLVVKARIIQVLRELSIPTTKYQNLVLWLNILLDFMFE